MAREDEIKTIAYYLWQEEGCVDGRDCEHWLRAEIIWEDEQKKPAAVKNKVASTGKPSQTKAKPPAQKPRSK